MPCWEGLSKQCCMPPLYGSACSTFCFQKWTWRQQVSKQCSTIYKIKFASTSPWGESKHLYSSLQAYLWTKPKLHEWSFGIKFGHDQKSRNSWALNLVCPGFKGETEVGQTSSVRAARSWNTIPNSLKKIEFAHKCAVIKRPQLTFMYVLNFLCCNFYYLITSYLQIFSRIFNCNFRLIYVYF